MKKLYLVDVSSFFFRAYYAIPPLTTAAGLPTNALYGFLNMTIKLLRDIKPDYLAFCFDRKEKSFRFDLYSDYKANRGEMPEDLVPQVPYLRKLTEQLGIPIFDKEGYEADDVIGSLTKFGRDHDLEVTIVSGDKDFAQLVNPYVMMYDTMKDKKYDEQGVIEKWGVSPEQMIDYLAMVGDSSDNIPGIKGVGPKGAQKLLAEYKTLDDIYKNIDKVSGKSIKQKIIDAKEMAYLSQKLVTIVTDINFSIDLDSLRLKSLNKGELGSLLNELEFTSFARTLTGEGAPESQFKGVKSKKTEINSVEKKSTNKIKDNINSDQFSEEIWSLDQLKKNLQPYSEVYGILTERGFILGIAEVAVSIDAELKDIGRVLGPKLLNWKGFDLKYLWRELDLERPGTPIWDHMLAAYIIRAGNIDNFNKIYEKYTGKIVPDLASPAQYLFCYCELEMVLRSKINEINCNKILTEMELPLVPVLYDMEKLGIRVDTDILSEASAQIVIELKELEGKIFKESGEAFNIASPKQLAQILFEKLALPSSKKTKTGFSTNSDVLQKLEKEYPICRFVLEFRELSKLKSTYLDAIPKLLSKETHRIHTHFRQAATTTGRLSSINPNLQNIPIRTERGRIVRKAFVASEGHQLLSVDYSQIELRVLAAITKDKGLCSAFEKNLDIHAATASEIFDVALEEVTPDLRRKAKAVNFGIAYGQGVFGLAETLSVSRGEASEIISNYFRKFSSVKNFMDEVVEQAKEKGYVETLFGRRRYIDELKSSNQSIKKFGERAAINAPIQGTASDLVKKAMLTIYGEVESPMLLQVHDELLFECPSEEVEEQSQLIKDIMENVVDWEVPLAVNIAWGNNWDEAHA